MRATNHWCNVSRKITLSLSFNFSFLCHCSVSSSFGNTPVMCDDLPVILGNSRVEQEQSRDFEVKERLIVFCFFVCFFFPLRSPDLKDPSCDGYDS